MKVVINRCHGGYSLSKEAYKELGLKWDKYGFTFENDRENPRLVEVIEKLGTEKASGKYAQLEVIEIPDGISWVIDEDDGLETIQEIHRSWP